VDQITQSCVEISILLYFLLLNFFIFDKFREVYDVIEWICIAIMISTVSILALVNTSRSLYKLSKKLRRCLKPDQAVSPDEIKIEDTDQSSKVIQTQQDNESVEYPQIIFAKYFHSLQGGKFRRVNLNK
jgi:hypothetical protein